MSLDKEALATAQEKLARRWINTDTSYQRKLCAWIIREYEKAKAANP